MIIINQQNYLNMNTLDQIPNWYILLGFIWSSYQGFRGTVEHRLHHELQNQNNSPNNQNNVKKDWKGWEKWIVLYMHDFIFRFVCTMAGFISLYLAYHMIFGENCCNNSASEILVAFLSIIGIIGVGGQLHYVILLGKLPKY